MDPANIVELHLQKVSNQLQQTITERDLLQQKLTLHEQHASLLTQSNKDLVGQLSLIQSESAQCKSDLTKVRGDLQMMQGFIKLKQSMLDMKDKEIRTCKDTLAQLKEQVRELQTGQQQRQSQQVEESSEQLRAKVHSLAYINQELQATQVKMRETIERLEGELQSSTAEAIQLKAENASLNQRIHEFEAEFMERVQQSVNMQATINEQQSRFDQALNDFQEERTRLIEEHSNLMITKEADWQEQEASLRFQLDALKEHTQSLGAKCHELQTKLKDQPAPQISSNQNEGQALSPALSQITQAISNLKASSAAHVQSQKREQELLARVHSLERANAELTLKSQTAYEVEEMKVKCDIMGEQLRKALGINSNLTESYQKLRDDCLRTNEANKTLEQANAALTAQFNDFALSFASREDAIDIRAIVSQISNRTYAAVTKFMESRTSSQAMDLEKVRTQWRDMQTERAKERTLLKKVLKQLRKSIARAGNKEKLETLLKYLEEQLEQQREQSQNQAHFFDSIAERLQEKQGPLDQALHSQEKQSLKSEVARLETQVSTLSAAREVMAQELGKTQELYANLKREQEAYSGKSFEQRKTLIEQAKIVETQIAELEALRTESRIAQLQLEDRCRELNELRKNHDQLLARESSMSQVRNEYRLQSADAYLSKNLDSIRIENQELKLRVHDLTAKLEEQLGVQTILREDYQLIKANYQEALSSKVQQTDAVMSSPDDHPLKLDTTTQTSSSTLEAELAELFVNNESELYALSESLIAQLEELIKVFYAYSRSESKIDQVEVELRESIASKEKELAVAKEAFTKQNQLNASFRERIQQLQGQLQSASQKPQPAAPQGRQVMQQDSATSQLTQQKQQLEQRVQALTKEKGVLEGHVQESLAKCKDLEQQITKIRTDSSNQLRMSQVKTNEFKAEIAKLNKLLEGGALPPAMTPNVTITKLMQATLKAQKIVVTQQSLLEQQQNQDAPMKQ